MPLREPDWTNGMASLYCADARDLPLEDASVHCVITSPPYWGLRDYGLSAWEGGDPGCNHNRTGLDNGTSTLASKATNPNHAREPWPNGVCGHCGARQLAVGIGLEPTLPEWLTHIIEVSREVWRVLRDDGTYWLNLGDAYVGSGKGMNADGTHSPGGEKQVRNQGTQTLSVVRGKRVDRDPGLGRWGTNDRTVDSLPAKNLMGQPWRVAFALQDDGWILRSAIVWNKPNPMPESTRDRPTSAYEMLFLLAKCEETPQFWTHRDGPGTRTVPKSDYRWQDVATGLEYAQEPADYSEDMVECPDCAGAGEIVLQAGQVSMFDGIPQMVSDCAKCDGEGEVKRWKRVNLWMGHDYFYDADAVREPLTGGTNPGRKDGKHRPGKTHDVNDHRPDSWQNTYTPGLANARNVWRIPIQGRRDAHFATFPDELPRRCILAGTSAHGVCAECGAPWSRLVEKTLVARDTRKSPVTESNRSDAARGDRGSDMARHGFLPEGHNRIATVGWQPTCDHNAAIIPPTVLDPFVGSGTTLAVAQQLGRAGIGLDLNPEYLGIARKRLMKL